MTTQLRIARRAAKLTALQLADAASTLESRVYQIERGRYRPRPDEARRLAEVLEADPAEMFPGALESRGNDEQG